MHPNINQLCGWKPVENEIADFASQNGTLMQAAGHLIGSEEKDTYLWLPLLKIRPNWYRGAQGIGDCVSWGAELCATMAMALQHAMGTARFTFEAATESIYGGCRVEARGRKSGGWSDGAFGSAAAKWMRDWGILLRQNYSGLTGNPEHNLMKYSKDKAKNWGNFGCGGEKDGGKLDAVAKKMPIKQVVQITTVAEAVSAILNGYTISIASNAGFGRMVRNNDGIVRLSGRWAHQMMLGGIRFRTPGHPEFRCFQSWGKSCSGPDPGIIHKAVSDCSWWITPEDAEWIFRSGDCWAYADVAGMPRRNVDFAVIANRWYNANNTSSYNIAN